VRNVRLVSSSIVLKKEYTFSKAKYLSAPLLISNILKACIVITRFYPEEARYMIGVNIVIRSHALHFIFFVMPMEFYTFKFFVYVVYII
jgi:hypothetical protein